MATITINPVNLARLLPYAHKDVTRYAMHGVAVFANGALAATNGKIAGKIGHPTGECIVLPSATVKEIVRDSKSTKRKPDRAVTLTTDGDFGSDVAVEIVVHDVEDSAVVHSTRSCRSSGWHFPPIADVYTDPGDTTTFGLDFALLERLYKAAKASGATVGRVSVPLGETRGKDNATLMATRVEFRMDGETAVEALITPMRVG